MKQEWNQNKIIAETNTLINAAIFAESENLGVDLMQKKYNGYEKIKYHCWKIRIQAMGFLCKTEQREGSLKANITQDTEQELWYWQTGLENRNGGLKQRK